MSVENSKLTSLDSPDREEEIKKIILEKRSLKKFYEYCYALYEQFTSVNSKEGVHLELGAGAGFLKEYNPKFTTTDLIPYRGVDQVVDAINMPFVDDSVDSVSMLNVLHHIPDAAKMFAELERILKVGGRVVIIDQNRGWISKPILKYVHHEAYEEDAADWQFKSEGPLSSANGALAWIIFSRDIEKFKHEFPRLKLIKSTSFAPLSYWLCGGLKDWCLMPGFLLKGFLRFENAIARCMPPLGSFRLIVLVKVGEV